MCECFTDQVGHSNFKVDEDLKSDDFFLLEGVFLPFFLVLAK